MNNLTVNNGLDVKSGSVSLPAGCITNAMLANSYTQPINIYQQMDYKFKAEHLK